MADVTPVAGIAQAQTGTILENNPNNELGKEAFLQIMLAQLQHQDPLSPMENQEFVSQLAQLNALEQQINTNQKLDSFLGFQEITQAAQLIGRSVQAVTVDGIVNTGEVQSIIITDEGVTLDTDIGSIPIESVVSVF